MDRVLDTSYLCSHWRTRATSPLEQRQVIEAEAWADELIKLQRTKAIVTPTVIEFVAGVRSSHELKLARAYLARFTIVDSGRVLAADWQLAQRLAERVPRNGKPRHLGDCLIKAIAQRLHCEVLTLDLGMPR